MLNMQAVQMAYSKSVSFIFNEGICLTTFSTAYDISFVRRYALQTMQFSKGLPVSDE